MTAPPPVDHRTVAREYMHLAKKAQREGDREAELMYCDASKRHSDIFLAQNEKEGDRRD